jgi:predicted membrane GTPase involved in stress response
VESMPVSSSRSRRTEGATHPEYPIELTCLHLYEPFQLTFARHALQLLPEEQGVEVEATHRGLILRGETESALEGPVEILQEYFGSQIRVSAPAVRYHRGTCVEEPHMSVRVKCSPNHFAAVKVDLASRGAIIVDDELTSAFGVIRVTAPLARLLGYARDLAALTHGTAHLVMWLSHYAPIEATPPEGGAA